MRDSFKVIPSYIGKDLEEVDGGNALRRKTYYNLIKIRKILKTLHEVSLVITLK